METTLHPYQRIILQKLMYQPLLTFSELQLKEITSRHFTYHLNQLKTFGFIEKIDNKYSLTIEGKKFVATVDEKNMLVEKQPKVSVAIYPERISKDGSQEILLTRRTKQPNYGKVVGISGKLRFGETFEEAARRELAEETGLSGDFQLRNILRKIGYQAKGQNEKNSHTIVLDILFILFSVKNVHGKLIEKTPDQENFWCRLKDVPRRNDISETLPYFIKKCRLGKLKNFEVISEMSGY